MRNRFIYMGRDPVIHMGKEDVKKFFRWLFPPTAVFNLFKMGIQSNVYHQKSILRAQYNKTLFEEAKQAYEHFNATLPTTTDVSRVTTLTHDHAQLDSMQITPANALKDFKKRPFIVYFCSDNACYENNLEQMLRDAINLKSTVVGFNYRGVNRSRDQHGKKMTKSPQDNVLDGIVQVQRLLDEGVRPQQIVLVGKDYGMKIAAKVAQFFQKQRKEISALQPMPAADLINALLARTACDHHLKKQSFFSRAIKRSTKQETLTAAGSTHNFKK